MAGRPFLQIPGPTLVPERVIRAISQSLIDHRGPKFAALLHEILEGLTVTAVCMPDEFDSDAFVAHAQKSLDMSLGIGLGKVRGKVFRIGHLGSLNELELLGGLAGLEITLKSFGIPVPLGAGLAAAETYLLETASNGCGRTG